MGGQGVRCVPRCALCAARRGQRAYVPIMGIRVAESRAGSLFHCFSERDAPGCGGMEQELLGVARTAGAGL